MKRRKQIKLMVLIAVLSVFTSFSGCEKMRHQRYAITLRNDSYIPIIANLGLPHMVMRVYPDTLLPIKKEPWYAIKPSAKAFWDSSVPWDKGYFKELPLDTLSVYIMKKEIYDTQNWEEIRDLYMILQRYDLSINDLKKLNYNLSYPPTEAMRNMKMYPAYQE